MKQHAQSSVYRRAAVVLAAGAVLSAGCASTGNPRDPLEGFNRAMFAFNEGVDKAAIKPLAQGYDYVVPLPGKTMLANFFSNLNDPWIALNNLMQGKPGQAFSDAGRFLINTTVGIGGAFDVASEVGLEKHEEDLGQTLGRWGVGEGPFLVVPLFGPRTLRDGLGRIADGYADPLFYGISVPARNSLYATRWVSDRAQLLPADKAIEEAALDKYVYVRDAYLQRRRNLIYDGNPPRIKDDEAAADDAQRWDADAVDAAIRPMPAAPAAAQALEPFSAAPFNASGVPRVNPAVAAGE